MTNFIVKALSHNKRAVRKGAGDAQRGKSTLLAKAFACNGRDSKAKKRPAK